MYKLRAFSFTDVSQSASIAIEVGRWQQQLNMPLFIAPRSQTSHGGIAWRRYLSDSMISLREMNHFMMACALYRQMTLSLILNFSKTLLHSPLN